jgi:hypothetical protein
MAQSIQRQLEEIEVKQKELEDQGVRLERTLRGEEGGDYFEPLSFLCVYEYFHPFCRDGEIACRRGQGRSHSFRDAGDRGAQRLAAQHARRGPAKVP